jgi:Neuraminidase (sialidase)
LTVQGRPVELNPAWSVVPDPPQGATPKDLPRLDCHHLPSLGEHWKLNTEHNPDVTWVDRGTNYDELTKENFWIGLSRSKDGGKTWSEKERLNLPFPSGRAYQPIKGKAGGVVFGGYNPRELSDGSIAFTAFWRNKPDGTYHSDQVQFYRSSDGGRTWSVNPVDATEWARNESSWVELSNGELLCVMRSNFETYLGVSRSRDKGNTWSHVQPIIPYHNPSAPSLLLTRDNVLILATRNWGLFTSVDNGYTWSLPTDIGSYTGGGWEAQMRELPDGRILVGGPETGASAFITVDREGVIHPATTNSAQALLA